MPTNVSTSFFFINLLFQARRAGSNPRPSCIPRCVAARDKSRPGRRAMARAHQEGCARARPSAWVLNSRPWRRAMARAHQEGCARARPSAWVLNSRCVAARDKSRPWRGLWPALIERIAHVRGVWLVGDWKSLAIGEFGRAQCIWVGQNPRAGWGQGAVLGFPFQAGWGGNSSERDSFLVSFAQKLDAKNTGIPVKQRERHFAVILVEQGKQFSCIYNF